MLTVCLIGLGSNLGDRAATLTQALDDLDGASRVAVNACSSFHETAPVGGPAGQGVFLNAAATLATSLSPWELLSTLRAIERKHGRTRNERWSARTLDLDLLMYG